jgi:lipopolysaccharide/colanic/teichoic acid biosynthesis glycosyltransferase
MRSVLGVIQPAPRNLIGMSTAERHSYVVAKRVVDVTFSAVVLVCLAPLMAAIAIAVRLDSPGPAIFRHARLGRFGKPFLVYKFRSMRAVRDDAPGGLQVTAAGDSRITRVGRFLRRYKLDELPQFANVLKGDMSLVGPRPEVDRYARLYPDEYERILSVRPGLTDFATLEFRHEEELLGRSSDPEDAYQREVLPAKIRLYLRYLDERSLRTDLALLAQTARHLLR